MQASFKLFLNKSLAKKGCSALPNVLLQVLDEKGQEQEQI